MSGEIIVYDANAILRGTCDAVEGNFSGTLATDVVNMVSTGKIQGGAISKNMVLDFGAGITEMTFTVPAVPYSSVVEIAVPFYLNAGYSAPKKKKQRDW